MMKHGNKKEKKYTIVAAEFDYSSTENLAQRLEEEINKTANENPSVDFRGFVPIESVDVTDDISKIKLLTVFETKKEE